MSWIDERPIMVGQAPSRTGDPRRPCTGAFGRRLAREAGVDPLRFMASFERRNLLPTWPGRAGKGDLFPTAAARAAAAAMLPSLAGRDVLLAGRGVAVAFGLVGTPFLTWVEMPPVERACVIPHPSGVSTWWNDSANRAAWREFVRAVLPARATRRPG